MSSSMWSVTASRLACSASTPHMVLKSRTTDALTAKLNVAAAASESVTLRAGRGLGGPGLACRLGTGGGAAVSSAVVVVGALRGKRAENKKEEEEDGGKREEEKEEEEEEEEEEEGERERETGWRTSDTVLLFQFVLLLFTSLLIPHRPSLLSPFFFFAPFFVLPSSFILLFTYANARGSMACHNMPNALWTVFTKRRNAAAVDSMRSSAVRKA